MYDPTSIIFLLGLEKFNFYRLLINYDIYHTTQINLIKYNFANSFNLFTRFSNQNIWNLVENGNVKSINLLNNELITQHQDQQNNFRQKVPYKTSQKDGHHHWSNLNPNSNKDFLVLTY